MTKSPSPRAGNRRQHVRELRDVIAELRHTVYYWESEGKASVVEFHRRESVDVYAMNHSFRPREPHEYPENRVTSLRQLAQDASNAARLLYIIRDRALREILDIEQTGV